LPPDQSGHKGKRGPLLERVSTRKKKLRGKGEGSLEERKEKYLSERNQFGRGRLPRRKKKKHLFP